MEFHLINIICAALSIRAQTEKTKFLCKDDWYKALDIYILEWGQWTCTLYIDKAHMALDIFHFAVFFFSSMSGLLVYVCSK